MPGVLPLQQWVLVWIITGRWSEELETGNRGISADTLLAGASLNEPSRTEIQADITSLREEVTIVAGCTVNWSLMATVSTVFATVLTAAPVPPLSSSTCTVFNDRL
jgi:hypothetical protein